MNALLLRLLILAGIAGIGLSTLARANPMERAGDDCNFVPSLQSAEPFEI